MHVKVTEVDGRFRRHTEYSWNVPQMHRKITDGPVAAQIAD